MRTVTTATQPANAGTAAMYGIQNRILGGMMPIETLDDIAEDMADLLGVYGPFPDGDHPESCECRICFVIGFKERVRAAVAVERRRCQEWVRPVWG